MHDTQQKIILKLIHNPETGFNQLWNKEGESNKFAYHLHCLENAGLVKKSDDKYSLTDEGRKLSAFIEGDTGKTVALPMPVVVVIPEKDGKWLCQKRLKEPFYGYWGLVAGKINFGFNILECAKRDLKEETGLTAKHFRLAGIEQIKTFEEEKLIHHHILFIVMAKDIDGELIEKTHKGENAWMTPETYFAKERIPEIWFRELITSKRFVIVEGERHMKNGKFTHTNLVNKQEF